jgi:ferredoxin
MPKILKVKFPDKCIGCELCVAEAQRQLGKIGPEGSFIRIFRESGNFSVVLDPQVNFLDVESIKAACPTGVYEVLEVEEHELLE